MTKRCTSAVLLVVLSSVTLLAQDRPQRSPLRGLTGSLIRVGAPALTEAQVEQLRSLLSEFRESLRSADQPDGAIREAREAFQSAVLSGDAGAAGVQADVIASLTADMTRTRLENQAYLSIQVLDILSEEQIAAVLERIGTDGLSRLLGSLGSGRRSEDSRRRRR